jgi:hypothetical protein
MPVQYSNVKLTSLITWDKSISTEEYWGCRFIINLTGFKTCQV